MFFEHVFQIFYEKTTHYTGGKFASLFVWTMMHGNKTGTDLHRVPKFKLRNTVKNCSPSML